MIGYNVHRSTTNGSLYVKTSAALVTPLTYSESSVAGSTTCYYPTTAVDPADVKREYSSLLPPTFSDSSRTWESLVKQTLHVLRIPR